MEFQLKKFSQLSPPELYGVLQLRNEVFIVEQNCAYQDMDGKDQESWHLLGTEGGRILAYARLLPPGLCYEACSIGRVVVKKEARGKDAGRELMKRAVRHCAELFGAGQIVISAQSYLLKFYRELGFREEGEEYLEDDIPHWKMRGVF